MNVEVRPLYANVFLLSGPEGRLLVDSGALSHVPRFAALLRAFRPDALLLTHAHVDHAGNAFLAARAGVPVLAHPLEHPALLGQLHDLPYPAGFPALGRVISRAHPKLRSVQAALPGRDVLGWRVVHLPGHTPGQVGMLRDGVLIAGDAVVGGPDGAHLPRAAYNHDHAQALDTLRGLLDLDLREVWPGHGGRLMPEQIRARAERDG
ncbi:MBL fold metallo-hydrolase [Deinococcus sedimenti]|uniref:MBL fold metallo-hydrolase n=1 Tax=Deinococcus sedimenti TaxID=1867090 RepID=A0ABQ2S0Z6_9DEIO|nr:MBL fold metallo-hydrolase [Deinococcus sedimenti]GGR81180.1 MBL fold metallo-hydrolase [Deinococcus sedimenti]